MVKLLQLEWKKHDLRPYHTAVLVIAISMLLLLYLFAYMPRLELNESKLDIFVGYNNLIALFSALNMSAYCILAAVMYNKIIITEYIGKVSILLFTYPISRKKVMFSKLLLVCIYIFCSMMCSNLLIYLIFMITESFVPLVADSFTITTLARAMLTTLMMSCSAISIGIIALGIGFIKKSVAATIVSSILIASLLSNSITSLTSLQAVGTIMGFITIVLAIAIMLQLLGKVERMEVE